MIFPDDIGTSIRSNGRQKTDYHIEGCRIYFIRWLVQGTAFTLPGMGILWAVAKACFNENNWPEKWFPTRKAEQK